jgi:hypothetical protein
MDQVISEIIRTWGTFGLIIVFFGFVIWDKIKSAKDNKDVVNGKYKKDDLIYESLKDIKDSLTENVKTINEKLDRNIDSVNERIDELEEKFDSKIDVLENRFDQKINDLHERVESIPTDNIQLIIDEFDKQQQLDAEAHDKAFEDILRLGDNIHDILTKYTEEINCNHIFISSFHNGSETLSGIPYIKFNMINEVFHPTDNYEIDHPFSPVYKDCELSLCGKLPNMLVQNKKLYFKIEDDGTSEMEKYDNMIIRRMKGFGIKQIALQLTTENNKPSGFVGCVRYDDKEMDLDALELCVRELEIIHNNRSVSPKTIKNKKLKKRKK